MLLESYNTVRGGLILSQQFIDLNDGNPFPNFALVSLI